jgi:L-threonylcarbamoyladenylate synthase
VSDTPLQADPTLLPALDLLERDGLVAYPTETLWGLGARATSSAALMALRAWKGRAPAQPISVLVGSPASLEPSGLVVDAAARRLVDAFWPGPLTLVLRCRGGFGPGIANAEGAVGVRCSPHPVASALARAAEARGLGPITATSLNRTGEAAASSLAAARAVLDAHPGPLLIEPGDCDAGGGAPSTVLDLAGGRPRVLREGAVPIAAIADVLGRDVEAAPAV